MIHFKGAPKDVSDLHSTAKNGTTEISDSGEVSNMEDNELKNMGKKTAGQKIRKGGSCQFLERCSVSGEDKLNSSIQQNINFNKGHENCYKKVQKISRNWWFIISNSLVAITIICFITGSYLAVRTKTYTISLTGHEDKHLIFTIKSKINSGYPKSVVVSSQGPAAEMFPQAMGVYTITSLIHSDRPVWRGREGSIVFNGKTMSFNDPFH